MDPEVKEEVAQSKTKYYIVNVKANSAEARKISPGNVPDDILQRIIDCAYMLGAPNLPGRKDNNIEIYVAQLPPLLAMGKFIKINMSGAFFQPSILVENNYGILEGGVRDLYIVFRPRNPFYFVIESNNQGKFYDVVAGSEVTIPAE